MTIGISQILKEKGKTFKYGEVMSYSVTLQRAVIIVQDKTISVKTALALSAGDTVLLAKNDQDKSWIVVEMSSKSLPSQKTLLAL